MTQVANYSDAIATDGATVREQPFKCDSCGRMSLWRNRLVLTDHSWVESWIPRHQESREFPDVPEHIAQAASEATLCLSVGAYRAVGSLARAVIEATAKEKGIGAKTLEQRIEAMYGAELIRKHTKEQAHEIRHFGNDMAHGDFTDPVTKEEAEEVIELMAEVLDEVYQSPARLAARKAARQAKTSGATS